MTPSYYLNQPSTPPAKKLPESMMANTAEVKLGICHGCKMKFDECYDRKYRDICLHAVLDYIKEVEGDSTLDLTEFGFCKAYHNAYISQLRVDLMRDKGKYELNPLIHIPPCMIQSSLDDAVQMAAGKVHTLSITWNRIGCGM